MAKDSFVLHNVHYSALRNLSLEQKGVLLDAMYLYSLGEELPELDPQCEMAWFFIKNQLDIDSKKYKDRCEKNAENAKKRTLANANDGSERNRTQAMAADNDNDNDINIPPTPKGGVCYPSSFEMFWDAYPKKVGKGYALKAWKRAKDKPKVEEIVEILNMRKKSTQWRKNNGQYIQNPATWINGRGWEDEILENPLEAKDPSQMTALERAIASQPRN